MYRYLDRPAHRLTPRDGLLLWSMRGWVSAMGRGTCPCSALGPVHAANGLGDLLRDFNMAMMLLNKEAQGRLRFAPPCFGQVADDEARLLALFAAENDAQARRLAAQLVQPEAVVPLAAAVMHVAATLATVPVRWPIYDAEGR